MSEAWRAYVLQSLKNGRRLHRSTNDLKRRLEEHARGKNRYTRKAGPFKLVYSEACSSRLEARRRELYLKTGKGRDFLDSALRGDVGD